MGQQRSKPDSDVVELLVHQHQEIRRLFGKVERAGTDRRGEAFDELRRLLAVHETAEEEIVHPQARRARPDGDQVVDARLQEENEAKQLLQDLEQLGVESPRFLPLLRVLKDAVFAHARHEEREEFPRLKDKHDEQDLRAMATAVKAAEALAPTHPHPGVESATKNLLIGPYAAMMDRTRDAVRQVMRQART